MLTSTAAARVAGVAPSTIKRWADQGRLRVHRTAGGHRRFDRLELARFLGQHAHGPGPDEVGAWIEVLVRASRYEIDSRLLQARARAGSWHAVADELGGVLSVIGERWLAGELSVAEEHVASEALHRSLVRMGDAIPVRADGPRCLLACVGGDDHTLGLALAELCLRELGWTPRWLGRDTPLAAVLEGVARADVRVLALSASSLSRDEAALARIADQVGAACEERGVRLVLGGAGAWPDPPRHGHRLRSFAALHACLGEPNPTR
jgi:excisionase family DNA binding protein